jgi:hypothetical protein
VSFFYRKLELLLFCFGTSIAQCSAREQAVLAASNEKGANKEASHGKGTIQSLAGG